METKLKRIAEMAKVNPNEKFTSLAHLINKESLKECHKRMNNKKSTGVDGVTKSEYEANLDENLEKLLGLMKSQSYKPQPVKRVYIPKAGTEKKRPLGIPAYEDKLVQSMLGRILNSIYEQDFMECSFEFRPNRGAHDALKILHRILNRADIHYVLDADIKGFFDNVDHEWLKRFISHRIADPNIQRLITRFLKAGCMEAGIKADTPAGTPQGGVCSPILANIYLHYVIDLWFEKGIRKRCKGNAYMIRYADDIVFCFQYEEDAKEFYETLKVRLAKFKLEVAEEKTKIIKLNKRDRHSKTDENFEFLGFTHYVDKQGRVKAKTSKKNFKASLLRFKNWMRENRTLRTPVFMKMLKSKLQGHINYYGISNNYRWVNNFAYEVKRLIFKWLNRRSQRKSFSWASFAKFLSKFPLPAVRIKVNLHEPGSGQNYLL